MEQHPLPGLEQQATMKETVAMQKALAKCLPGFRFSPTEQELVGFYLTTMVQGKDTGLDLITTIDLYKYDPWELPELAQMGDKDWYFFVPRDLKYPNGSRPNRVAKSGYWKATGTDRLVMSLEDETGSSSGSCIGLKKTLVFYKGKAPKGVKTPWIMNEFRLHDMDSDKLKNDFTLCRVYRKGTVRALNGCCLLEEPKTPVPPPQSPPREAVQKQEDEYIPRPRSTVVSAQEQQSPAASDSNFMFYGYAESHPADNSSVNPQASSGGAAEAAAQAAAQAAAAAAQAEAAAAQAEAAAVAAQAETAATNYAFLAARLGLDHDFDWTTWGKNL